MKTIKDLRKAYEQAVEDKQDCFSIDDYDFVTNYAKYLLEHLKNIKMPEDRPLKSFLVKQDDQDNIGIGG